MVAYGSALSRSPTEEGELSNAAAKPTRVPYSQQQRLPPWTMKNIRWAMGTYITLVHILGLAGLFYVPRCKAATLWWAFVLWPCAHQPSPHPLARPRAVLARLPLTT